MIYLGSADLTSSCFVKLSYNVVKLSWSFSLAPKAGNHGQHFENAKILLGDKEEQTLGSGCGVIVVVSQEWRWCQLGRDPLLGNEGLKSLWQCGIDRDS